MCKLLCFRLHLILVSDSGKEEFDKDVKINRADIKADRPLSNHSMFLQKGYN